MPLSRPQIAADITGGTDRAYMIFRADDRGWRMTAAICPDLSDPTWTCRELTDFFLHRWEPSYDTELWKREKKLHIFTQEVGQGDDDGVIQRESTMASFLEWSDEGRQSVGP